MNCVAAFSSGPQPRKIQKVHASIECFKMHNEGQDTDPSMSNLVTFQTQVASIIEILAKTAVAEINRRVDDSCAVFRLEISQSQREIETLKHKLQVLESEFMKSRRKKTATVEHSTPAERLIVQEWSLRPTEGEDPIAVEEVESLFQPSIKRNQPEPLPIKKERMEEAFCYSDSQLTSTAEEQETQTAPVVEQQGKEPTPVGDPEERREQHRCGHSDEELSGLEFVVKAEQEEEHVARRLNQTGCELSAGRLNNLDSENVTYETDNQLSTSFTRMNGDVESNDLVCSSAPAQCSQSLSIHPPIHHTPATVEGSGHTRSLFGASYAEEFNKLGEKPSVCSEELRSEAIHTQQGQYRERLVHTVERENQTLLPQQQQHGPSVKHRRGSESPAQPHSGSQYETGSTLSSEVFYSAKRSRMDELKTYQSMLAGERRFCCSCCGRSFTRFSHLKEHHRSHTGEKPYSCAECGKKFSKQSNLIRHTIIHSGQKPYRCVQCGKGFTQRSSLKSHQKIHTGQTPIHCVQYLYPEDTDFHQAV